MKRKNYLWIPVVAMLITSISLTMMSLPVSSNPTTVLSVSIIEDETLTAGSTFHINVTVADVSALWGFQFNLTYDTNVLTATGYSAYAPFVLPWPSEIDDTAGWVAVAYSMPFGETEGFSTVDPAPLARIDFTVDAEGDSLLDLQQANVDSVLSDVLGETIPHENVNGYFSSEPLPTHDIAVTDVTINVTETQTVLPGVVISINVTVFNKGSSAETFNVTTYYDTTSIDTKTVTSLASLTFKNLTFYWDTTGLSVGSVYTVKAVADVTGDEDLTSNELAVDYTVQLGTRDVAIISVAAANMTKPNPLLVNVTVKNEGDMTETFNVTVFYGTNEIGTQTVTLSAGANTTLTFTLNTTGIEVRSYAIEVKALPGVPGETDLADNTMSGGVIYIKVPAGYPEAHFDFPTDSLIVGETVTFDASTSFDADGTIVSYAWDFGDGATAFFKGANLTDTANHTYTERRTILGSGTTFTVTLTVTDNASQSDTVSKSGLEISSRDIAVIDIDAEPTQVRPGGNVNITVTVENQGDFSETFNMSVFYDTTLIETQTNITLSSGVTTLTSIWNTTGVAAGEYTIKAQVTQVQNETDTTDNTRTLDAKIKVGIHDIAITSVSISPTTVTIGDTVSIDVDVENQGDFTETFDVTVYYDNTQIDTQTITDLAAGASETATFTWNTTDVDEGTYAIKAIGETVTGETETNDNTKTSDETVTLEAPSPPLDILPYAGVAIVAIIVIAVVVYLWKIRKS